MATIWDHGGLPDPALRAHGLKIAKGSFGSGAGVRG